MKLFVGVTDTAWYNFLANRRDIEELNFWQPGGKLGFRVLSPGEPFLFKLKAPYNAIAGGGFFAHATLLPLSLAWEAFGEKNGVASLEGLRQRIAHYRRAGSSREDFMIGCIILQNPFFLPESHWIRVPDDFAREIVVGKGYDTGGPVGRTLWESVRERMHLGMRTHLVAEPDRPDPPGVEFVEGVGRRRLGQGTFRVIVTDMYERHCAVSREKTLPVLEAAHIKPVTRGGTHAISNGLLLRSDIHTLFDRGYITVTPDLTIRVSDRLRKDWHNGRIYYEHDRTRLWVPGDPECRPSSEFLEWHADTVFMR